MFQPVCNGTLPLGRMHDTGINMQQLGPWRGAVHKFHTRRGEKRENPARKEMGPKREHDALAQPSSAGSSGDDGGGGGGGDARPTKAPRFPPPPAQSHSRVQTALPTSPPPLQPPGSPPPPAGKDAVSSQRPLASWSGRRNWVRLGVLYVVLGLFPAPSLWGILVLGCRIRRGGQFMGG